MLRYKFKHLEKHHRKELSEKVYRATRNYDTIGDLLETIDTIIDIYLANGNEQRNSNCNIPLVSNRRELLSGFAEWWNNRYNSQMEGIVDEEIEEYIATL